MKLEQIDNDRGVESQKRSLLTSLSGRLLLLTIIFVMLAEVLIYVPSIANFCSNWLTERLAAAQIASLAVEATMSEDVDAALEAELLNNAGVLQVVLRRDDSRMLMLAAPDVPMVDQSYDLREATALSKVVSAFGTLFSDGDRILMVKGTPEFGGGELIEVILRERDLRDALLLYSRNILLLSLVISILTAGLVFVALRTIIVGPMRQMIDNMTAFGADPQNAERIIKPASRVGEMRLAEEQLASMQTALQTSLQQKNRLAALGTAVSKINHDLRNILTSAQLISDRIATSDDPKVQSLTPKLVASIDRAVALTSNTLKYGRAQEPPPKRAEVDLATLVDAVGEEVALTHDGAIAWCNDVPSDMTVRADPDQLFRVLLNLARNAGEAIAGRSDGRTGGRIAISAAEQDSPDDGGLRIDVHDNGPGIPDSTRTHLFEAFTGSGRAGGTGLGLAIAKELVEAHGGTIALIETGPTGTLFRITLPGAANS